MLFRFLTPDHLITGLAHALMLALCCLLGMSAAVAAPVTYMGFVTKVSDGDTLWVQPLTGGAARKLRMEGIDAPEICQTGGPAARDALAAQVLRQVVTVRVRARDTYGRGLAVVLRDGQDVAASLVRQGHAWSPGWRGRKGPYAAQEALARAQRRGVFALPGAQPPSVFRRTHGPCAYPRARPR